MIILIILPIDRNWLSYYGRWWYDGRLSQTIKGADNQVSGTKRGIGKQDVQRAGTKQCYLQQISSGKTLPSMGAFFRICEYLETLPIEFFWDDGIDSIYMHELLGCVKSMTKEDADYLLMSAKYLSGRGYTSKNQIWFFKSDLERRKVQALGGTFFRGLSFCVCL